jgi:hypothetical protein
MQQFIAKFEKEIQGVLSGSDSATEWGDIFKTSWKLRDASIAGRRGNSRWAFLA